VNDALPLDVLQHSIDARAAGYRRVFETGWSRVDAVKTALSAGYPVVFGQVVDDTFLNYGGGVMGAHDGTYRGGHATTIMGYDRAGNFLAVNSWGDSWGEMGDYRFVPERLASAFVVDCWILTLDGDEPRVS
jgi:hypothetical protein